jgi:hypothetical protein
MFLWEPRLGAIAELAVAMLSICRRHSIGGADRGTPRTVDGREYPSRA